MGTQFKFLEHCLILATDFQLTFKKLSFLIKSLLAHSLTNYSQTKNIC